MKSEPGLTPKIDSNLDTNFLKIIGIFSMLIDHLGKIFFPDVIFMQTIGRIAFPLFAYCVVVGSLYTSDIKKYALRLAIFAVLSQPIYALALNRTWSSLNIFFSLLIGLLTIYALKEKKWLLFSAFIIVSLCANLNYGIYGILLMIIFYLFRHQITLSAITANSLLISHFFIITPPDFYINKIGLNIQGFAILSIPLIYTHTNFNVKINKYLFYIFYPAHLLIFYLIKLII